MTILNIRGIYLRTVTTPKSQIVDISPLELLIRAINSPVLELAAMELKNQLLAIARILSRAPFRLRPRQRDSKAKDGMLFWYCYSSQPVYNSAMVQETETHS